MISNLKKKRLASKDRNSKKGATDYYQAGSLFRASDKTKEIGPMKKIISNCLGHKKIKSAASFFGFFLISLAGSYGQAAEKIMLAFAAANFSRPIPVIKISTVKHCLPLSSSGSQGL